MPKSLAHLVFWSVHLIPAFAQGKTNELLSPTCLVARMPFSETKDWQYYYVNMYILLITLHDSHSTFNRFVDCDMFMRFLGGGVGHKATNALTIHLHYEVPISSMTDNVADYVAHYPGDEDTEENNYGYCIGDSNLEDEDGDEGIEGDDVGAEDGEESWDMSVVEVEGYNEI